MFSKILIANRGEIALRIIRACKEMGVATVAVFSTADENSLHVSLADESICIGPASVSDSYLNISAILSAAVLTGAEAIHPGYGLLSENHKFARLCTQCGISFIGPSWELIQKMGDKDQARSTMKAAGVPVVPGSDIINDSNEAHKKADEIGYPLLVKARSGGGGKGIRLVERSEDFLNEYALARQEAQNTFNDDGVYLEKFLTKVKHIEIQLLCDRHRNVVALGERECSIQRKNQKLLEESPSPSITPEIRNKMIAVSRQAALTIGYENAGTIEFLMDTDGHFYFMEMNTRLQVEHPITEMVTGIDIVKWQIRIAADLPLTFEQEDVIIRGHAIECRINAENPLLNFRPNCGTIEFLHVPGGPWVRFDTLLYQGYTIPPYYDSMVGKLIVHSKTRELTIRKMKAALCELVIEGIDHTSQVQLDILSHPLFIKGDYYTDFMENEFDKPLLN
ncbi:acetyl-CoA carboxylase biotin carboxylase subunit [Acetobacterium woodii]|uniref:Biotin carboxylase n=1 Tax=Acetobacterium woodii (strain ATCC 29683 / DSM 1030 / JCM 2381 / KCTC 1655 / WB1) TaxID=931626 RepID=H6LJC9_ACEWD|nr:acetyl-CoA carboxylase biotin carboxylase subunit [Acetobacterium woodii]AFA48692.1 biotin carboxylase AccC [Acetobacterium woodii DSM 1030]